MNSSDNTKAYYAKNNEVPSSHSRVQQHRALCAPYNQTAKAVDQCSSDGDCAGSEDGSICMSGLCSECFEGQFLASLKKKCLACSEIGTYQCAQLNQATRCLGVGFYSSYFGQCGPSMVTCTNTTASARAEVESCKACPNRCFNVKDSTCRLFGEDKDYLKNEDGTCGAKGS